MKKPLFVELNILPYFIIIMFLIPFLIIFIHSFIHSINLYSASSGNLLRGAPSPAICCCLLACVSNDDVFHLRCQGNVKTTLNIVSESTFFYWTCFFCYIMQPSTEPWKWFRLSKHIRILTCIHVYRRHQYQQFGQRCHHYQDPGPVSSSYSSLSSIQTLSSSSETTENYSSGIGILSPSHSS